MDTDSLNSEDINSHQYSDSVKALFTKMNPHYFSCLYKKTFERHAIEALHGFESDEAVLTKKVDLEGHSSPHGEPGTGTFPDVLHNVDIYPWQDMGLAKNPHSSATDTHDSHSGAVNVEDIDLSHFLKKIIMRYEPNLMNDQDICPWVVCDVCHLPYVDGRSLLLPRCSDIPREGQIGLKHTRQSSSKSGNNRNLKQTDSSKSENERKYTSSYSLNKAMSENISNNGGTMSTESTRSVPLVKLPDKYQVSSAFVPLVTSSVKRNYAKGKSTKKNVNKRGGKPKDKPLLQKGTNVASNSDSFVKQQDIILGDKLSNANTRDECFTKLAKSKVLQAMPTLQNDIPYKFQHHTNRKAHIRQYREQYTRKNLQHSAMLCSQRYHGIKETQPVPKASVECFDVRDGACIKPALRVSNFHFNVNHNFRTHGSIHPRLNIKQSAKSPTKQPTSSVSPTESLSPVCGSPYQGLNSTDQDSSVSPMNPYKKSDLFPNSSSPTTHISDTERVLSDSHTPDELASSKSPQQNWASVCRTPLISRSRPSIPSNARGVICATAVETPMHVVSCSGSTANLGMGRHDKDPTGKNISLKDFTCTDAENMTATSNAYLHEALCGEK